MVSNQHLPVMPTTDLSIPPREVYYYYYYLAAVKALPCSTEEGTIDAVSSRPVVALESSSSVDVEDKEMPCCKYFAAETAAPVR